MCTDPGRGDALPGWCRDPGGAGGAATAAAAATVGGATRGPPLHQVPAGCQTGEAQHGALSLITCKDY